MGDVHHPDWDDDELVPLGDLRPSKEHFGPVPDPNARAKKQASAGQDRNGRPQPRQRPQSRYSREPADAPRVRQERPTKKARETQQPKARQPRPAQQQTQRQEPRPRPARREREPEVDIRDERPARPRRPKEVDLRDQRPAKQQRPQRDNREQSERRPQPERRPAPQHQPREHQARHQAGEPQMRSREPQPQKRSRQQKQFEKPPFNSSNSGKTSGIFGALSRIGGANSAAKQNELEEIIHAPVIDGSVAVFSRKGGVGKTTISAFLGMTLATIRGGRILAVDGDAEAGSLGWLMAPQAPATLAALSEAKPTPSTYDELCDYTTPVEGGLEIVVGDTEGDEVVNEVGLENALVQVARNYDISIFDTGGGVSVTAGRILVKHAKVILLVMGPSVDSIRAAERTLAWIEERPGESSDPDVKVIAVINGIPNSVKEAHIRRIEEHFAPRCSAVVRVPWDEHLAEGPTQVSLDNLSKGTRKAFEQLAATTIKTMARRPSRRNQQQGGRRAS